MTALTVALLVVSPGGALAAPGYDKVVVAQGPDLYWRLGESSGDVAVDRSGNGHDGVYHGPLALGLPGAIVGDPDTAAAFGGDEYYAAYKPQSSYAGDFTVLAWIKKDQADHVWRAILSTRTEIGDYSFDLQLREENGVERLQVDSGDGSQWVSTGPGVRVDLDVGHWYQVAATVTSTAITYYVDGEVIGDEDYSMGTGQPLLWDAGHTFTVGDITRYYSDFFVGNIDEVAVFLRALPRDTIKTLYLAASSPTPRAPTTTTLSSSDNPSSTGQTIEFTATVANVDHPADEPSGTVTFTADGAALGAPVTLDATGRATLTTAGLTTGKHQIRAVYGPGSAAFWPSEKTITQAVWQPTTTTVTVKPDPTVVGQGATFTAQVAGSASDGHHPNGKVQFTENDGTPIGPPVAVSASGNATITLFGDAGNYLVHGRYLGDDYFAPSEGSVRQTIDRAGTATKLTVTPNPVTPGGTVTVDVDVAVLPPGDTDLDGSLQFLIDDQPFGDPIDLTGATGFEATLMAPTIGRTDTMTAQYLGGPNTKPSSDSVIQTVSGPAVTSPPIVTPAAITPPVPRPPVTSANSASLATALRTMTATLKTKFATRGLSTLRGFTETFVAPAGGRLAQQVYTPSAPSTALPARKTAPTLLASGTQTFAAAGTRKLTVKPTAAGRRLARRKRGGKVTITVVTRFAPVTGKATRRLDTLKVPAKSRSRIVTSVTAPWPGEARWPVFPAPSQVLQPGYRVAEVLARLGQRGYLLNREDSVFSGSGDGWL